MPSSKNTDRLSSFDRYFLTGTSIEEVVGFDPANAACTIVTLRSEHDPEWRTDVQIAGERCYITATGGKSFTGTRAAAERYLETWTERRGYYVANTESRCEGYGRDLIAKIKDMMVAAA